MNYLIIDCFNFTLIGASVAGNLVKDKPDSYPYVLGNLLGKMLGTLSRSFPGYVRYGVWDTYGGTSFRKEILPEYKANRDNSRFDFRTVESMSSVYEDNGVTNVSIPECEADDAIHALCRALREKDPESTIVIASRDEDMIQIVQSGLADRVWNHTRKSFSDIPVHSVVDMKALAGDSSDNIKGISGIGPKTALKVMSGVMSLTESQKAEFEKYKDVIDLSRNPKADDNYRYMKEVIA